MSIFGTIGYFLKEAWEGFAEIVVGPLTPKRPLETTKTALIAAPKPAAPDVPAPSAWAGFALSDPQPAEPPAAVAPTSEGPASAPAAAPIVPPNGAAKPNASNGSGGSAGEEDPASPVAQRYRTLKAEGLLPKHASEFSRSAKKYDLFRRLSTTRAHDGAVTYWERVKDFEEKAAAHAQELKDSGASKPKMADFKKQTARARDVLIRKYGEGGASLAKADADFAQGVAALIGFEEV